MHTVQMAYQRANENDRHNWNTMHGGKNVAAGWISDYYHIQRPVYVYNILKYNFIYVFTTTYAISAYHHISCELKSRAWRGALDSTLCEKNCQWLAPGFLRSPLVSSTNKTDIHDIAEILLKVALNTIISSLPIKIFDIQGFIDCPGVFFINIAHKVTMLITR